MTLARRTLLAAAALPLARPAFAQAWPARPIRVLVPFAAGGAADSAARTILPRMGERLSATFVVENRTGASGSIGGAEVARSAADGYTLLWDASSHIVNHAMLRGLVFDYATAFLPISQICTFPQVVAVKADFPARDIAAFIAAAKARTRRATSRRAISTACSSPRSRPGPWSRRGGRASSRWPPRRARRTCPTCRPSPNPACQAST